MTDPTPVVVPLRPEPPKPRPTASTEALITSWSLALHDRADSTRALYADVVRRFAATLPGGLLEATRRDCHAYFASLRALGRSQATMRSRWIALRSFYAWATAEEEIDENPMLAVKVAKADPPPPDIPDDDDLDKLLKACKGRGVYERRDLAMIRVAAATGMRVAELCALRVDDVDLATRLVVIRHGKGDRRRVARIDAETGAALDRYVRARASHKKAAVPQLWLSRFGPFGRKGAMAMLTRRCTQAGIPHLHWHLLRHRYAHEYLARGGQEGDLAKLGGWEDATVMRRYGASLAVDRALANYDDIGGVL
jgi:site-specific recombinase XerD